MIKRLIRKIQIYWYKNYNKKNKKNETYPYLRIIRECSGCIHKDYQYFEMGKKEKCPYGHLLKVVGHSCCDDICECECGKWFVCGLGSIWKYQV